VVVVQALGLEGSGAGTAQRQGAEHRDVTGDVVTGKRCGQVDLEQGLDVRCVGGAEQPGRGGEHAPLDVGHGLVKQDAGLQRQVRGGWSRGGAGVISSGPPGEKGKGVAKIAFGSIR
jgi:hypothetical protein